MGVRLGLETAAARAVGSISRAAGRGGGTTLPGKLLWKVDPTAVDALAARLPAGSALVSATNGKTTTTAMSAGILGRRSTLAWNRAGANLLSGIASALLAARGAERGLFEVDEAALPEAIMRTRPKAIALSNLFRDQLDRYGELELVAERWRAAVATLPAETVLVVNGDDPVVADLADGRVAAVRFGVDDPRHARTALQHAADSKYCLRCGVPYAYEAAYVGHLGDYRCPSCGHARPQLDVVARDIELRGLHASRFRLVLPAAELDVELALPGLYNVYNAVAAAALATALGTPSDDIGAGLTEFSAAFGRFERIAVGSKRVVMLLVKNPAGANEVLRTLETGIPPVLVLALNDAIADGRDVSWIWDVDFEPLLPHVERVVVSGERAAELGLRLVYGGLPEERLEVVPELETRTRPRTRAGRRRHRARRPTDLHGDAGPPRHPDRARARPRVLGAWTRMRIRVGHLYPEYLNIYADRGNIAVLARRARLRGHELDVSAVGLGAELAPNAYDLLYVGGGQDREQALVAPDLAGKGPAIRQAVASGVAVLAVCGGYQLLGGGYRGRDGSFMPGAELFPHETVAGETRMIGDVLLDCELDPGERRSLAGFENHAGRTMLDPGAEPLGRVVHGFGNDGASGFEGCRVESAIGTYLHGPLLPRNPWLADWLLVTCPRACRRGRAARARTARRRARRACVRGCRRPGSSSWRKALRAGFRRGTPAHHPLSSVLPKPSRVGYESQEESHDFVTIQRTHISPR